MSKAIWIFLLGLVGILALWQGSKAAISLWSYHRLSDEVPAKEISYRVQPSGSRYVVVAAFSYGYGSKDFKGSEVLPGPLHLNRSSAELEISRMQGMERSVWLNPKRPAYSSLEKNFPYRQTLYGICTLGVFIYFLCLFFFYASKNYG